MPISWQNSRSSESNGRPYRSFVLNAILAVALTLPAWCQSGDDLLLQEEEPSGDALLQEEEPSGDALLQEEGSDGDALLQEEASGGDALLQEDDSGDDALLQGETSGGGDSLLGEPVEDTAADEAGQEEEPDTRAVARKAHEDLFQENRYPSADTCATCHERQYKQWAVSPHSYAQISPVFNAMQKTVNLVTSGTNGDFCIRCHSPVGMNLGEGVYTSNFDRLPAAREGITCVVCHRVNKAYGKISGRLSINEGDLLQPVYGPRGNEELERVLDNRDQYRVVTDPDEQGRKIHTQAKKFFQLTTPGFCGTCHDVNLLNGFRLEEAFSEYKHSPSVERGESCQDCHMGKVPGVKSGYERGPAAVVGGEPTKPRKLTNHMFVGPDYSVVHPGIFPHNTRAKEFATLKEWLTFDYEAGWGTDEFEYNRSEDYDFPARWRAIDDRYDARDIIEEQLARLDEYRKEATTLLKNGYQLGEVVVDEAGRDGIEFKVQVKNATAGHNVPTGFIAERVVALQVTVTDGTGKVVFKSGDLDPNGDVRDLHSLYVHNGELPLDEQLFSLQSRFLTRMVRGGEREQVIAVNYSPDPLPYIRPSTSSTILTGRPRGARTHRAGIEPLGHRWAEYHVDAEKLQGSKPPYSAKVRLLAGMIPVNLIDAIKVAGFDYGMSPRDVAEKVVEGHRILWERNIELKPNSQ